MTRLFYTVIILLLFGMHLNAQIFVGGTVTTEGGEPLMKATVQIEGTSYGTTTNAQGVFTLNVAENVALPFNLVISYTGYETVTERIELNNSKLSVQLKEAVYNIDIANFVVSASRKREKITEAPAAISVLSARQLAVSPDINPTRSLGNLPGVHLTQQSANRINIEMRGNTQLFGTSVFPIMDYRNLISSGVDIFQSSGAGLSNIDLAQIEVVRGPGSALYGPGVTAGVVHFITKNPMDYTGTTIEVQGGELATFGFAARHATKLNDKFAFKINASYNRGNEFTLDPNSEDSSLIKGYATQAYFPAIKDGAVDLGGERDIIIENLDEDGDGNPIANDYYNLSLNTTLQWLPVDDMTVFFSAGYQNFNEVFYNNQGPGMSQVRSYWTQARMQYKGLFAQLYYNNSINPASHPSFLYGTGAVVGIDRQQFEGQVQYNFGFEKFLNADITVGGDYRLTYSDSGNRTYGRNEANDDYLIAGVYAQSKFELVKDKLDLLVAGRLDRTNVIDKNIISPRVAFVYKPAKKQNIRATYNRSASAPSALTTYLDLPISQIVPNTFILWAYGGSQLTNYQDNNMIDLTPSGLPDLPIGSDGLPLDVIFDQVNNDILNDVINSLGNDPYDIQGFLQSYQPMGNSGNLVGFDIASGEPLEAVDQTPVDVRIFDTYEVGYSGFIQNRLKITLDVYYNRVTGFTNFTAIGPTYALSDANIAGDLYNTLLTDLTNYLVNDKGLSQSDASNEAMNIATAYQSGGTDLNSRISPFFGIFGAAEGNVVPDDPNVVYVPFGYRSFDNTIDYYGADLGLNYYFNQNFSAYFNFSYLSQNEWIPGEPNDDGLNFRYFLNTPRNKFRVGGSYTPKKGFFGSLAFQHTPSFNVNLGLYSGVSDVQNLVDATVGYHFENGVKVAVAGTNIFNTKFRTLPNFPLIGRRVLARMTYSF